MPALDLIEPVVRRLESDEEFVVNAFERHAIRCDQCVDAVKTYDNGGTLCDRGNQYAVDVDRYIYGLNNKAHSVVDHELNQSTLLQIPLECECVRRLLLAIQYGLPLRLKDERKPRVVQHIQPPLATTPAAPPVISYDRTYPVAPRVVAPQPYDDNEVIERVPFSSKRRRVIVYPSSSASASSSSPRASSTSRGSLYEEDAADRVERLRESPRNRPIDYYR